MKIFQVSKTFKIFSLSLFFISILIMPLEHSDLPVSHQHYFTHTHTHTHTHMLHAWKSNSVSLHQQNLQVLTLWIVVRFN